MNRGKKKDIDVFISREMFFPPIVPLFFLIQSKML